MEVKKHPFYQCHWDIRCVDKSGKLKWEESGFNNLVDQGEMNFLDAYFRAQNIPSAFYARLARDILEDTDTLLTVQNEPEGNGYAPQLIERNIVGWPTLELHDGDYRVISKELSWTASGGDIGPINLLFLATTPDNTGLLIGYMALSVERTILDGDTMIAQAWIKLK